MANKLKEAESYLIAKLSNKSEYQGQDFASIHRNISPSGRFLVHQYYNNTLIVYDLLYQKTMEIDHLSRCEPKNESRTDIKLTPLYFVDERFVLFVEAENVSTPIITLAEFKLEKRELYYWDSMKIDRSHHDLQRHAIVVNSEDLMNHVLIMYSWDHEIALNLKLENTSDGARICKSSLNSSHPLLFRLEHRMLNGSKMYGFPWKPEDIGIRVDMTEIVSYEFETKTSEIIKLEGLKRIRYGYTYEEKDYYGTPFGCWMGRRFFCVFEPKNLSFYCNTHVIFCLDLDKKKWQSTQFVFNKRIRQLSVANDQLVVEAENGFSYYSSSEAFPVNEVINCYQIPIKCPASLQQISFEANRRYLRDKPKLAEEFEQFILPEELRKIEFN